MRNFHSVEEMIVAAAETVRPPERLTVSQAAEKYRYLNNPGSYVGKWKNSKTPYLVEPMDTLDSLEHTGLIFAGPARTGKSDMFFNWLTKTVVCDPADMMVYHMTQNTARDWSLGDLAKVFRHTTALGSRLVPGRQNNNVHDKQFIGGMRLYAKWPTITEMSGKTMRFLWLFDYDRMPDDIDKEGTAFDLARKRAGTFKRFGMCVAESSPGRLVENPKWLPATKHEAPPCKGILGLYNRGDRRRWYWRCPQCHEAFEGDFSLLSWPNSTDIMESVGQVVLVCPHDGFPMEPEFQEELNEGGKWIKDGQVWLPDGRVAGTPIVSDIASFWLKGTAAAFTDWRLLVQRYLEAVREYEQNGSEDALKTTTTTDQGLPYTAKAMLSDRLPEALKTRAEDWGGSKDEPVVPPGVRFLIATIDVQARAFVVQLHGFGVGGDVWIAHPFKIRKSERVDADGERFPIDPAGYPEDWRVLIEQVIERTYPLGDDSGRRMQIKATVCDSGGREGVTANAYAFWRYLRDEHEAGHHRRFMLVKGEPKKAAPRFYIGYPDANRKDRHSGARGDVPVVFLNSNLMKDQVSAMLSRTEPGGGMVHFPIWAEDWLYSQLTTEFRTTKGWENPRKRRNEAWDLLYYAVGICLHSSIRLEHIDWGDPPAWADEWDKNALVIPAGVEELRFGEAPPKADLGKLAQALA